MIKKRYFLYIFICALLIVFFNLSTNHISYASSSSVEIISPDMNKYLFLDSPEFLAIKDDVVAVYDSGSNKIYTAGNEHNEYTVTLSEDEKITSIVFANNTLYYLTSLNRLHDVNNDSDVNLQSYIAIDLFSYNDILYFYNSLINVYKYDGNTFSEYYDSSFKLINSTHFATTDSSGYFYKDNAIYTLNYENNTSSKETCDISVDCLIILNDELHLICGNKIINYIDKSENTIDIISDCIASDNTNISILDKNNKCIYKVGTTYSIVDTFGKSGNLDGWFNNPRYISYTDNGIVVYDKGNARLQILGVDNIKKVSLSYDFDYFTASDDYIVLSLGSNVTIIKNDSTSLFNTGYDIGGISIYDNNLYVYDKSSNSIYFKDLNSNSTFYKYCAMQANVLKMVARDDVIYVLTSNGIFTNNTDKDGISIQGNNIISFDVDYVGNVITIEKIDDKFVAKKYSRTFSSYESIDDFEIIDHAFDNIIDISIGTNSDIFVIDNNQNLLAKITGLSYVSENDYVKSSPIDTKSQNVLGFKKSLVGTIVYNNDNNFNDVSDILNAGDTMCIIAEFSNTYFVITNNGKTGYVSKDNLGNVNITTLNGKVVALFDSIGVYNIPSTELGTQISFDKSKILNLVDDAGAFNLNGTWVKVSYEENGTFKYGYALKSRLMSYIEPKTEDVEKVIVKAKASRVGEKIKGYAMADSNSAEVFSVNDGSKLILLEDFDENSTYTLVEYNGTQGYVLTKNIQVNNGLTDGQIAAISLFIITIVITGIYLVISKRRKKLKD